MGKSLDTLRVPPSNIEAEQSVIGAMLMNPDCIPKVKAIIQPDDFYRESHIYIVKAIYELKGKATTITVPEELNKQNMLEKCGGSDYISSLMENVTISAGVTFHADIIYDLSKRRQIIDKCAVACEDAFATTKVTEDILSDLKGGIISLNSTGKNLYPEPDQLIADVFKEIEKRSQSEDHHVGILSGFPEIDSYLNGFEPKTLTYLIGRPSMGKTALGLNIAENMAENCSGMILFFSLEMGNEQITRRRIAAKSQVYLSRIRSGNIQDSQWRDLIEAADNISRKIILIDHPKFKTVENLVSLAESFAIEHEISAIFVDHIQLMNTRKTKNSRHHEISHISNEMKSLAKTLTVPNIVLCQLSRKVEQRRDKKPILSDMKESGDLEQDSDLVIGIYRDDPKAETMYLAGLKGRDVGTWTAEIGFDRFTQKCMSRQSQIPF